MFKDYYEILELTNQASSDQVRQNYRKLALRSHPNSSKQPPQVAARTFADVAEAFQVLSDAIKRAFYDKYGYQKFRQGFFEAGQLKAGYRLVDNPIDIFENFIKDADTLGSINDLSINTNGTIFGQAFGGQENKIKHFSPDLWVDVPCSLDELFKGATKVVDYERRVLNTDGRTTVVARESKKIHIKAGYNGKTILQYPEQGHQTVHRTVSNLYFQVKVLHHPKYHLQGQNLVYTHDISLSDALNCSPVQLVTLDGRALTVGMDQIATPQSLKEVPGQGFVNQSGQRGSLYIRFNIIFPIDLSLEIKEELRRLLG